jgi:effector-binding domain-containing protein
MPSYCFNWADPTEIAGHKQSGDIDNPDNFENHKKQSGDYANSPLTPLDNIDEVYKKYFEYIENNKHIFNQEYYNRYYK